MVEELEKVTTLAAHAGISIQEWLLFFTKIQPLYWIQTQDIVTEGKEQNTNELLNIISAQFGTFLVVLAPLFYQEWPDKPL